MKKEISCKHRAITGVVGERYYVCLDCRRKVFNDSWKEDKKAIQDQLIDAPMHIANV